MTALRTNQNAVMSADCFPVGGKSQSPSGNLFFAERQLEDAGLIVRRIDGTKRPRRLAKAGIEAMRQWLAMLRKALEKNYDRLDEVLVAMDESRRRTKR